MSWIDPLKRLVRLPQVRHVEPKPEPPEPEPEDLGVLAQSARILKRAHVYRQEMQRQAEIQARDRQERERREQAARQTQWEDEVARSLALRWSYFPGDGDQARDSGPQVRRLEGTEDGGPFYGFVRW